MFTGLVEAVGRVLSLDGSEGARVLRVAADILSDASLGGSVAVNGCCLTIASVEDGSCRFDLSPETLSRTTLGALSAGDAVNLERPVRLGAELGGHVVQGHIDGVGQVRSLVDEGGGRRLTVEVDPLLGRYLVEKGSVTVDGVSLTVTRASLSDFEVALVPHTLSVTTLGGLATGGRVNIEIDVLAKYVERLVAPYGVSVSSSPDDGSGYL